MARTAEPFAWSIGVACLGSGKEELGFHASPQEPRVFPKRRLVSKRGPGTLRTAPVKCLEAAASADLSFYFPPLPGFAGGWLPPNADLGSEAQAPLGALLCTSSHPHSLAETRDQARRSLETSSDTPSPFSVLIVFS